MAVEITELVGAENMNATAKEKVISILKDLPQPATVKRYLYARWAQLIGYQATAEDLNRVAPWNQGA